MQLGFHEIEDDLLDCKLVDAVWTFHSSKTTRRHIVPDGRTDLIFSFDVGPIGTIKNVQPIIAPPFVMAHSVISRAHQGYVGIRLKSGSGGALLNTPLRPIVGKLFEGRAVLNYAPWLFETRYEYQNAQCLLASINRTFAKQHSVAIPSDVTEALTYIDDQSGEARIGDLARELGMPVRTLNRRFTHSVGLSPKQYAQIIRLRQAVHMLAEDGAVPVDVAASCGFSDQAHLTREVKRFMGHTPRQLSGLAQDGNLLG